MEITTLESIEIEKIVSCLTAAFKGYFVEMPTSVDFWKNRFSAARVDYSLSFGILDKGELVGFILHGIDFEGTEKIAFNTGTGILPNYRGKKLVDKLYSYAFPLLVNSGITKSKLEVIDKNERAIKVYERIGFKKTRKLKCFKGHINCKQKTTIKIAAANLKECETMRTATYSWDNTTTTISNAGSYSIYKVLEEKELGYFIINPQNGYIAQLESLTNDWKKIFEGICLVSTEIKINNIDETRTELLAYLDNAGIENTIDQYEMEVRLGALHEI
jgi:RimJ/RimL family protein N-acetyltransferase